MSRIRARRPTHDPPAGASGPAGRPGHDATGPAGWRMALAVGIVVALAATLAVLLLRGSGSTPAASDGDRPAQDHTDDPGANDAPAQQSATFAPTDEPPPPLDGLVGEEFETVVRTQYRYWEWLYQHPAGAGGRGAADLLDNIYHPDCPCRIQERLLAHYAAQGWWWTGGEIRVLTVEVLERPTDHIVRLRTVLDGPGTSELIDSTGTIQDVAPPREAWVEERVYVREGPDSPWRLLDGADQGPLSDRNDD